MDVLVANLMFHMYVCEPPTTNVTMQMWHQKMFQPQSAMIKKKEEKVRFTSMFILDVMLQLCRSSFCLRVFSCFRF